MGMGVARIGEVELGRSKGFLSDRAFEGLIALRLWSRDFPANSFSLLYPVGTSQDISLEEAHGVSLFYSR